MFASHEQDPLLRLYAGERADDEETGNERGAAVARLLDWYLNRAGAAAASAAGNEVGQAAAHPSLADVHRCQGCYDRAVEHYSTARSRPTR